jgi:hypothetical protein
MHICYLDESGVPQKNAGTTPYFVLLGLAIPARTWRSKDAEIAELLNEHNVYGEVHTAWMARMYPEQERISDFTALPPDERRKRVHEERARDLANAMVRGRGKASGSQSKNYAKTDPYVHLSYAERWTLLRAIADKIGSWDDAVIFADAQRKAANSGDEHRVLEHAFEQVVTGSTLAWSGIRWRSELWFRTRTKQPRAA